MAKIKRTKKQTIVDKILCIHRKIKIEQRKTHWKSVVDLVASEGKVVPAPLVVPVVLLLNDTNIIWYGNRVGHQYM